MDIITDTNIISYCCPAMIIVGLVIGLRLLTAQNKRPKSSYYHFGATSKNLAEMYNGDEEW